MEEGLSNGYSTMEKVNFRVSLVAGGGGSKSPFSSWIEPHGLLCIQGPMFLSEHLQSVVSTGNQTPKPADLDCPETREIGVCSRRSLCGTEPWTWSGCCFQILELICRTPSWCPQRTGWGCWTILQGFTQVFLPYLFSHPPYPLWWLSNNLVVIFCIEKIMTKQKSSFLLCLDSSAISITSITTKQWTYLKVDHFVTPNVK